MTGIRVSGPLFNGQADRAVQDFLDDARREVAQQAHADVMRNLDTSIRHPTPYYETQINIRDQGDASVVNDRGIVYGPWLEMGGHRRHTRFKGYASFRRATATLQGQIPRLVDVVLRRHIAKMGG